MAKPTKPRATRKPASTKKPALTHVNTKGEAHMVEVSAKRDT